MIRAWRWISASGRTAACDGCVGGRVGSQVCTGRIALRRLLAAVTDADFRDFLLVLRHTGCRPQEARIVEARHCDFKAAKIKFAKGDVPGKPWEREIPLNETAYGKHIDKREEHLRECIEKGTKKYRSA